MLGKWTAREEERNEKCVSEMCGGGSSSVISVIGHCKFGVIRPSSDPGILGEIKYKRGGDTEKLGEYRAILLGREFGIWNHKHWYSPICHCSPVGNRRRCIYEIPKSYRDKSFCFNFKRQTIAFFSGHVVGRRPLAFFSLLCLWNSSPPATSTGYSSSLAITFVHSKQYL